MILTYKVRHRRDFSGELRMAKQVADYAVVHRTFTSRDVKHIGLKSVISNQILRKYGRNTLIRNARNVNLIVPSQGVRVDRVRHVIFVSCLKLSISYQFPEFEKVNQIEVDKEYVYVSVTVPEVDVVEPDHYVGVDLNATGHAVVVGDPQSGKVWKLGKRCEHVHKKYRDIRRLLQREGKHGAVKCIKNRESRIIRDLNHKMSKKIVDVAGSLGCGIKLERLEGIHRRRVGLFGYSLNSWSFCQLRQFVEYKAKLRGIAVACIEPAYTSKMCSKCGHVGDRNGKRFKCLECGHVENADVNASFNIALRPVRVSRSGADRDALEGSTDTPQEATARAMQTLEPRGSLSAGVCQCPICPK